MASEAVLLWQEQLRAGEPCCGSSVDLSAGFISPTWNSNIWNKGIKYSPLGLWNSAPPALKQDFLLKPFPPFSHDIYNYKRSAWVLNFKELFLLKWKDSAGPLNVCAIESSLMTKSCLRL